MLTEICHHLAPLNHNGLMSNKLIGSCWHHMTSGNWSSLGQVMAWHSTFPKLLPDPVMTSCSLLQTLRNELQINFNKHYSDVIMSGMASQITSISIYLLHRLFRHRSKKISKLCFTGLCEGNPPVTGGLPSLRVSNAEDVSIWWHYYEDSNFKTSFSNKCISKR